MTIDQFTSWMNLLKETWEARNPEKILTLCSDDIIWHETPFAEPYRSKEEVFNDWKGILNQENISFTHEI